LSAFDSFCRGATQGRFPQLNDRNDLWQLLVVITVRKALDLRSYEGRQKRGGGAAPISLPGPEGPATSEGLDDVVGSEPTPEFAAQVAEEYRRLLDLLADEQLCRVAQWKMEGYTTEEIAPKLGCVPRTVERKLQVIRTIWSKSLTP
jgi:DNA-directed RNA polymerase specialized sigma24 family protein